MADVTKQRICIKSCFKLNKTAAETQRMLKEAFGQQALSQARTLEWFKRFKDGQESVEDRKHSGRPSTCTTLEMIAKCMKLSQNTDYPRCWEVLMRDFETTEGKM